MANMLIRTRRFMCYKTAIVIRVILFFGIPIIYFLFRNINNNSESIEVLYNDSAEGAVILAARDLLSVTTREDKNCTHPAILEFPADGFTRLDRQHGFIIIHCLIAIYCFLLLGCVCEQYFVPAIEIICELPETYSDRVSIVRLAMLTPGSSLLALIFTKVLSLFLFNVVLDIFRAIRRDEPSWLLIYAEGLDIETDVAGATFMAAASSSPELFINCVGTFVTEGDLGVGAVVGSAVFNVLAVPACCALIAGKVVELDWWSVSRDCVMYAVAVVTLILTLLDGVIYWHEALLLVLLYTLYILAMVFNGRLGSFVRSGCCSFNKPKFYTEITPLLNNNKFHQLHTKPDTNRSVQDNDMENGNGMIRSHDSTNSASSTFSLWTWPDQQTSMWRKCFWIMTWPITLLLWATIPDCRQRPYLYPLTFAMCITWIGGVSYLVAWMITVLGDTLDVPDSITGLTILAAGTSLPEAVSSVLVTKQGYGTMGISNSIGSNTFDILLCLGLPWLVKSLAYPTVPGDYWVTINSSGLSYSAITLLSTLFALYGSLIINKFQLDWKIGVTCAVIYIGYLILAGLIELNVFSIVNLPMCAH